MSRVTLTLGEPIRFLLDTCFISDLAKPYVPPSLAEWAAAHDTRLSALSVMTIGEVRRGIELLPHGKRRDQLADWLGRDVMAQFQQRILNVDDDVAQAWGTLSARARAGKRRLSTVDGLLLATAMVHNLAVVTRNVRHFSGYDVHVINPWGPAEA